MSLEGVCVCECVSSVSSCMDVWDDGYVNIVCECVCVQKCWHYFQVVGGGGSSLLVPAISERANFHLKEHSAPLCLPFLPIALQLRPPPSPSSSVSAISLISTPLSWPSLSLSFSLSLSLTPKCPKSINFNAFMHALSCTIQVFSFFFWVRRELFPVSSELKACDREGGGWKKWKQDKRLNDKIDGSGIVLPLWMFDDRRQIFLHLNRGRVLKTFPSSRASSASLKQFSTSLLFILAALMV